MTDQNKARLIRLLLPLLAVLVGTLLTAFAFFIAGYASVSCNCSRPITIAFPYASVLWGRAQLQSLGGALMAFQFPAYALIVALARSRSKRLRFALVILGVHALAVVIVLLAHKG
jgi:hypothetical protein